MQDLQTMLERISNYIVPTAIDKDDNNVLIAANGDIKIVLRFEMNPSSRNINIPPVQAVLGVFTPKQRIWSWGSTSEEDNKIIVDWFTTIREATRMRVDRTNDTISTVWKQTLGIKTN